MRSFKLRKYDKVFKKLVKTTKKLELYYDIDKIKTYAVFVWKQNKHVFDIQENEIIFYDTNHIIPEEVKPIIKDIQSKIKAIRLIREKYNI